MAFAVLALAGTANASPSHDLIVRLAPKVELAQGERYMPYNPDAFVRSSLLGWASPLYCRRHIHKARGSIDTPAEFRKLGGGDYRSQPMDCGLEADGHVFSSADYTRPWGDGDGDGRSFTLAKPQFEEDGFYLDADDDTHPGYGSGQLGNAPIYYQLSATSTGGTVITYWLFYAYDAFRVGPVKLQSHEGDWEWFSVLLDPSANPVCSGFSAHHDYREWAWSETGMFQGHPRVYVARGSHADYRLPGSYDVTGPFDDIATTDGVSWNTWARPGNIKDVENAAWWGYGGAWGSPSYVLNDNSGPAGPGPWKRSHPPQWDEGACRGHQIQGGGNGGSGGKGQPAPVTTITAKPDATTTRHHAEIYFGSSPAAATFECSLDGSPFAACANPKAYTSLALGPHTFRVRAILNGVADPSPESWQWTVLRPETQITAGPSSSSRSTATVYFRSPNDPEATFQCRFDEGAWVACTNPKDYSGIAKGPHQVSVRAVDLGAEDQSPATIGWTRTG